ncbi:archease [Candidatus Bathyarchaeota archaeon]|nr:MAG: archease [Candidatus Bathyarchaeota archaeon]
MGEEKKFEFLEHMADAYVAAYGKDLAEAFENAALAMFDVMTKVEDITPKTEDYLEVKGKDEYALLYNWLEALLVKFETEEMLYSKFKVQEISRSPKGFVLKARIWGEKYDPQKHVQKVGVKAVTYHRMEIIRKPEKITLKFILDI